MNEKPINITSTLTTGPYVTIKAATEAGFRKRKDWEYGGEEITIKARRLVRDPKEAQSRTEWSKRGYRVRDGAKPLCYCTAHFAGQGRVTYPVCREDQVEPKRKVFSAPPVQISVLAAVWVINRRAKRCRDMASTYYKRGKHGLAATCKEEKAELYQLKGGPFTFCLQTGSWRRSAIIVFPMATGLKCSRAAATHFTGLVCHKRERTWRIGTKSKRNQRGQRSHA